MAAMDVVEVLTLFNEKVTRLQSHELTGHLRTAAGVSFEATSTGTVLKTSREGTTDEAIAACLLTLRFFIQNNEATSLQNMEALYHNYLPSLEPRFAELRQSVNDYLDGLANIKDEDGELTQRQVFETFIWGEWAHANPSARAQFKRWRQNAAFAWVEGRFLTSVGTLIERLGEMKAINEQALAALSAAG